jgi:hypothetical protein
LKFISQGEAEKMGYEIKKISVAKKKRNDEEEENSLVNSALDMFGGEII